MSEDLITPDTKTPPKAPLATSTHGKRNHETGGMTYKTGLVLGSRILQQRMGQR